MATNNPDDQKPHKEIPDRPEEERVERELHIYELKMEANDLAGGQLTYWEADDCPPELAAEFWEQVVAYEKAPWQSPFQRLEAAGLALPAPEQMDDLALSLKLWEVIEALAKLGVWLSQTDHLTDRQLYTQLWQEILREEMLVMPVDEAGGWFIDLLGSGSDEDTQLYLKYYADEAERQRWRASFPAYEMPPHEDPLYDRDSRLPRADLGLPPTSDLD